jgi:hypothetical protein
MVGVGKDRNLSDQIKSYLSLFWGRAACLRVSLRPTYFTIARLPWIPLAGGRNRWRSVKKKCTCAVGLARTWYYRRQVECTVPAVRKTTPSLKGTRTRGCQQRAASTSLEGLVSPSTGAAVTVKRRTEYSVFDISHYTLIS